jgi:hypothetical protein
MQGKSDKMITKIRLAPEVGLDPINGVEQGVILPGRVRREPKIGQALQRAQLRGVDHVIDIVSQQCSVPGWLIDEQRNGEEKRTENEIPSRPGNGQPIRSGRD